MAIQRLIICLATVFILMIIGCDRQAKVARSNQIMGDSIVKALDHYQKDIGEYPNSLADLVPKYLDRIKQPEGCSKGWIYERTNAAEFYLTFEGDGSAWSGTLHSGRREWIIDDK